MKSNLVLFALTIGGALLFAGCTAPNGEDDTVVVEMKGSQFQPAELTIDAGTTVTWVNRDSIQHNAQALDGSFKGPLLSGGQTFEHTFDEPGVYKYRCHPHSSEDGESGMVGTIIVLNEDGSTPSPDGGADNGTDNGTA